MDIYTLIREDDYQRLLEATSSPINMQTQTLSHTDKGGMTKINSDNQNKEECLKGAGVASESIDTSTAAKKSTHETIKESYDSDTGSNVINSWALDWESLYFSK